MIAVLASYFKSVWLEDVGRQSLPSHSHDNIAEHESKWNFMFFFNPPFSHIKSPLKYIKLTFWMGVSPTFCPENIAIPPWDAPRWRARINFLENSPIWDELLGDKSDVVFFFKIRKNGRFKRKWWDNDNYTTLSENTLSGIAALVFFHLRTQ